MRDYDSIKKFSYGKFSYPKFLKIKELAKNTIGECNDIFTFELTSLLKLRSSAQEQIKELESKIEKIIKELDPPTLSIKGIGFISCAGIISEFGDISKFNICRCNGRFCWIRT